MRVYSNNSSKVICFARENQFSRKDRIYHSKLCESDLTLQQTMARVHVEMFIGD